MSGTGWDTTYNRGGKKEMLTEGNRNGLMVCVTISLIFIICWCGILVVKSDNTIKQIKMAEMGYQHEPRYRKDTNYHVGWTWTRVGDKPIIVENIVYKDRIVNVNKDIDHESSVAFLRKELEEINKS